MVKFKGTMAKPDGTVPNLAVQWQNPMVQWRSDTVQMEIGWRTFHPSSSPCRFVTGMQCISPGLGLVKNFQFKDFTSG